MVVMAKPVSHQGVYYILSTCVLFQSFHWACGSSVENCKIETLFL